jgi:TonB family protein
MNLKTDNKIQRIILRLSRHGAIAALLALTLLATRPVRADETLEKQVKADYLDKVLTLRHFYSGEHLKFHSDGSLQRSASPGLWTLDGQIEVQDVHLHGAQLVIKARRIHRIFDNQGKPLDQLTALKNQSGKQQKDLEKALQHLKAEIEIELPSDNPNENDVSAAIHAIFVTGSDSMMDVVPSYWRAYFAKQEGKPLPTPEMPKERVYASNPRRGGVLAPHLTYGSDPEYSEEARKARFMGTVVLGLVVDSSGNPTELQIQRPIGLGLDEMAIKAVNAWRFRPGEKDGSPVPVAINVEVNFHLY